MINDEFFRIATNKRNIEITITPAITIPSPCIFFLHGFISLYMQKKVFLFDKQIFILCIIFPCLTILSKDRINNCGGYDEISF